MSGMPSKLGGVLPLYLYKTNDVVLVPRRRLVAVTMTVIEPGPEGMEVKPNVRIRLSVLSMFTGPATGSDVQLVDLAVYVTFAVYRLGSLTPAASTVNTSGLVAVG
jgi:hypothetical protein